MEGYVTVLAEMESAATLPVLMHLSSTVSDGPGDPGGSRWQCCFTVRICVSKCRPECVRSVYVCATVFVRIGPDVCIHMVRWQHIWIVLALCQMHVVNILLCVWLSLHWTPPNLVFMEFISKWAYFVSFDLCMVMSLYGMWSSLSRWGVD